MSTSNINKAVLSSPRTNQKETESSEIMSNQLSLLARFKVEHAVDQARSQVQKETHQKRLKMLRKETDYLSSTAWMYQSVDKYIGH